MKYLLLILAAVLIPGGAPDPQQSYSVKGTVRIKGEIPKPRKIRMNDVENHCGKLNKGEVDADDISADPKGFVKWAFVYVKKGLEGKKFDIPKTPTTIQQQGCRYSPHVAGVMVGQDFVMKSGDPILHLPHVAPRNNKEWAFSQGKPGDTKTKTFAAAEVMVRLICDVHPWMEAWIGVVDHPFHATTEQGGKFEIKGLPPGTYTLEVWHEHFAPVTQEIEVGAATKPVAFELSERQSRLR